MLPRLSNSDFERAESLAAMSGVPLHHCPTCDSTLLADNEDEGWGGTYKFRGKEFDCDCFVQKTLRKHYLVANIPDQYQRLHWEDYTGSRRVCDAVESFLEKWQAFKVNGMGLEFYGANLGTGKTFAATHVGKELVKRGVRVLFIDFKEVISAFEHSGEGEIEDRLRTTTVLILDEVVPAVSERQAQFFAFKLEELVRHRTNFNLPTIMTTNLEPDKLHELYPRTYSLLEAKQLRVELDGEDARRNQVGMENIELAMNGEVRPIT